MSEPFLGEIRLLAFDFPPRGWALCEGQLLPINQNQALFALLGTTYGGDGRTTFALPDLRARVPVQQSAAFPLGSAGGEATHTLTPAELPPHTHAAQAAAIPGDDPSPAGRTWGVQSAALSYAAAPDVALRADAVAPVGGGQPHDNLPPYLVVNFCIALEGLFPSRF